MKTAEGRARLAISIAAVAVFAWGFGPLMVRGIDASARHDRVLAPVDGDAGDVRPPRISPAAESACRC